MTRFLKTLKIRRFITSLSDEEALKILNDELLHFLTVNRRAKVEQVIALINVLAKKLQIAFILPNLLENYKELKVYLNGTKYESVIELIAIFHKNNAKPADANSQCSSMHNLIDYVSENYDLLKYLPKWLKELEPNDKQFVKYMDDIKAIALNHFARGAINKVDREDELNSLHIRNEQVLSDTSYLHKKLHFKRGSSQWKTAAKLAIIFEMKRKVELYDYKSQVATANALRELKYKYTSKPSDHINRVKELEENYGKAEERYMKGKANNRNSEKAATNEKNKVVLQLQMLIKKYDETMLQKYRESIELDDELEKAKQELNKLVLIHNREEAIHYELVIKKEEEEERRIILKFRQIRAAKIIQRMFRKILEERRKLIADKMKVPTGKKKNK